MASFVDRLLGRERFNWSASDPAFAAWWFRNDPETGEIVSPYSVLGLSAVLRSVQIIATTIAGLPLRTYERGTDGSRVRIDSDFDDPYPGDDGLTPFSWTETVLIHLLLWREAFLWHEPRPGGGVSYHPLVPDMFKVKRENGRRVFEFTDPDAPGGKRTVGSEQITYIPGPSIDATKGHPLLYAARAIFSAALSGDKSAQNTLARGIRLGGLLVPADENEEIDPAEGKAILEDLRARAVGSANAGDIALVNRRVKLQPWTPSAIDSQWIETKQAVLGDIERLFGVPPHLLADTEKQTSWGSGVAEQNLSLARYTLRGWSDRIEQVLSRRLPDGPSNQFCEFDYKGLLQGTPAQEIELLIDQINAGILDPAEARAILNLPPTKSSAESLEERINAVGILVRSGFDPAASLKALGLPAIKHTGQLPTSVYEDPEERDEPPVPAPNPPQETPA